jgi:hypothetical protein
LESTRPAPLTVRGNGWTFDLSTTTSGYSASPAFRFEMEATVQPAGLVDLLQSAADAGTIEIVSEVPEGSIRWPRSVTLTMDGFSAAYAKLRKSCEPVRADAGCAVSGMPPEAKALAPECLKDTLSAAPPPPTPNQMPRRPWPDP